MGVNIRRELRINKRKEYQKEWYKNNRKKVLIKHKKWCENNPDYYKKYRKNNPGKNKKWKEKNKERVLENHRNWNKTEKGKANRQRGYVKEQAKEREMINTLTAKEWLEILKKYNYRCAYCGKEFNLFTKPERNHMIPISKGGNNTKENVVPACRSCNSKKYNKLTNRGQVK